MDKNNNHEFTFAEEPELPQNSDSDLIEAYLTQSPSQKAAASKPTVKKPSIVQDSKYKSYEYLLDKFSEHVMMDRMDFLAEKIKVFIAGSKLNIQLNRHLLEIAVLDYFADIYRLKDFHQIDQINLIKIDAYTACWLLKRHPLQLFDENSHENTFINEKFVCTYLLSSLLNLADIDCDEQSNKEHIDGFIKHLYYHLKYRTTNPQTLELMLTSFQLGLNLK